jgi:cysteinyl-tRNA synthetase
MLQLQGEKMSKSVGNLVSVEEFLRKHEADAFRMLVLSSSYRSPLTFNAEVVQQAERALERMRGALRPASPSVASTQVEADLVAKADSVRSGVETAMDDDFNTPGALSQLFELVRAINQARDAGVAAETLGEAQATLREMAGVLGLRLESKTADTGDVGRFVELLIDVRRELREAKQWALADRIRDRLLELGVSLEDSKDGTTWRFI